MKPVQLVDCEHTEDVENGGNSRVHTTIKIGRKTLVLCRACYGELLVQVLDDLRTIKVATKTKW